MAYYPDLSPYEYDLPLKVEGVLNVGWLELSHDFQQGYTDATVARTLRWLAEHHCVNQMRGFHICDFCDVERPPNGPLRLLGSAEIWVPAGPGRFFASPDLIIHYVEDHQYQPPGVYLEALASIDSRHFDRDLDSEASDMISAAFRAANGRP